MKGQIGNYRLIERIEPAGYTIVFRAEEDLGQGFSRPAAVKILRHLDMDDEAKVAVLRHEVEMLIEICACPNIVTIFGLGIDEELGPWIGMELGGKSLLHFITDEPAEPDQVRVLLRDTLRALVVVHGTESPILHRDLKPNNILSTDFGHWIVTDFGLAHRAGADETLHLATVQYAAPELLDTTLGAESPQMDLYSIGMVAYEFALGRTLYRKQFPSVYDPYGKSSEGDLRPKWMYWHTSMQMTVPPLAELIEDYPKDLSDLLASMTDKTLKQRPESAAHALASLGDVESSIAVSVEEPGRDHEIHLPSKWRAPILAVLFVAFLVFAGGVVYKAWSGASPTVELLGSYSGTTPIEVTGTIDRFPRRGSALVALPSGSSYPVYVDDDGAFRSEVEIPELGSASAFLKVLNGAGQEVLIKTISLERVPPESIEIALVTRPVAAGAHVVIMSHQTPDSPIRMRTNESGRLRIEIPYGAFDLEVSHAKYRRLAATNRSTGIDPVKRLFANLVLIPEGELIAEMRELVDRLRRLARRKANCPPGPLMPTETELFVSSANRLELISDGEPDIRIFLEAVAVVEECNPDSLAGVEEAAERAQDRIDEKEEALPPEERPSRAGGSGGADGSGSDFDRLSEVQNLIGRIQRLAKRKANCPPGPLSAKETEIFESSIARLTEINDGDPDVELFLDATARVEECNPESAEGLDEIADTAQSAVEDKKDRLPRDPQPGDGGGDDGEKRDLINRIERLVEQKANCPPGPLSPRQREILASSVARLAELSAGDVDIELFLDAVSRVEDCNPASAAGVRTAAEGARSTVEQPGLGGLLGSGGPMYPMPSFPGATGDDGGRNVPITGNPLIDGILENAPEVDPQVVAWLAAMPLDQFKTFVEENAPPGPLTIEAVPDVNQVRISGPLFDEEEVERLVLRLLAAVPRLQLELQADSWALCRSLTTRLEDEGAEGVRTHAFLAPGDHTLYVQFEQGAALDVATAQSVAEDFVINDELLSIKTFAKDDAPRGD